MIRILYIPLTFLIYFYVGPSLALSEQTLVVCLLRTDGTPLKKCEVKLTEASEEGPGVRRSEPKVDICSTDEEGCVRLKLTDTVVMLVIAAPGVGYGGTLRW